MKRLKLSRRQLLSLAGAGSAAGFLPSLLSDEVHAQDNAIRRVVFLTSQHGTVRRNWKMQPGDLRSRSQADFSPILQPLHRYRDQLLLVEGLAQLSSVRSCDYGVNMHNAAAAGLMTGAVMSRSDSGGPSVDQVIAEQTARSDQLASLEATTLGYAFLGGFLNSSAGSRQPMIDRPTTAFNRVFPTGQIPGGAPAGAAAPALSDREQIAAHQGSVLELVEGDYQSLVTRLSLEDRQRLEMHQDLTHALEQRLGAPPAPTPLRCSVPDIPGSEGNNSIQRFRAFADVTAAALACDRTRVASINIEELNAPEFGVSANINVHQDVAHAADSNAVAAERLTQYNAVHSEMMVYLLDRLQEYGILENTAVVWLAECATGSHELWDIPVVMAGSCGGFFKQGEYVSFPQSSRNNVSPVGFWAHHDMGPAHNHLFVSLMNAMGVDRNSIGEASIPGANGGSVDCSGPLTEIHA